MYEGNKVKFKFMNNKELSGISSDECNICGKSYASMIHAEFSFCQEYSCGITFCKKCVNKMKKLFDKKYENNDDKNKNNEISWDE